MGRDPAGFGFPSVRWRLKPEVLAVFKRLIWELPSDGSLTLTNLKKAWNRDIVFDSSCIDDGNLTLPEELQ